MHHPERKSAREHTRRRGGAQRGSRDCVGSQHAQPDPVAGMHSKTCKILESSGMCPQNPWGVRAAALAMAWVIQQVLKAQSLGARRVLAHADALPRSCVHA